MPRQPFEFKSQTMGDELFSMMVAESVPNSDILGPMFLPQLAHNVMLRFVNKPALSEALVVLGPPKSSKTAVLYDVLPRMVAARVGGLDPVFVRLTFSLANSPQSAAKRIWTELRAVAHAFSICETVVPAEVSLDDAILYLPKLVEEISKWCENKNGTEKRQLLLLMDEVSVRLYIISLVAFLHWIAHFFPTLGFFSAMFCRHLF
jgi:hypothetical protein